MFLAAVVKLVHTYVSEAYGAIHGGSSPLSGTMSDNKNSESEYKFSLMMTNTRSVTHLKTIRVGTPVEALTIWKTLKEEVETPGRSKLLIDVGRVNLTAK